MTWDNTQQWIDNSKCLYGIAIGHCSSGMSNGKVSMKYREMVFKLLCNLDYKIVAEELESYMSCNKVHDERVFSVWADKLKEGLIYLSSLRHILFGNVNCEEKWSVIWNEHRITEKENVSDFLWYLVVSLDNRFQTLQSLAESITKSYGLTNDTGFITMLIRGNEPNSDEQKSAKSICASSINTTKSIYNIIQCEDKEAFVKRLHTLIEGKGGKAVAVVFYRALEEGYITKYPSQGIYESEFGVIGKSKWEAIRKHFDKGQSADMIADAANIRLK